MLRGSLISSMNSNVKGGSMPGRTPRSTDDEINEEPSPLRTPAPKRKLDLKDLPDLLTIKEVSEILRVSPLTLKRWGKRGKLPAIRINSRGDRRYKKESILWVLGMSVQE